MTSEPREQQSTPQARYDRFLLVLLALSLSVNVVLLYGFVRRGPAPEGRAPQLPVVGTRLPALDVEGWNGPRQAIAVAGSGETLVYVFTPSCKWCERNLPNLREMATSAAAMGVRVIAVSLDPDVAGYIERAGLTFPVYVRPAIETVKAYGMRATPQTLLIASDGRLKKVWQGAYVGQTKSDVESWLGRPLPGLQEPQAEVASVGKEVQK